MTKSEYLRLHYWIRKTFGKAKHCSNDKTHKSKYYHWANISGEYKKDINDYRPLCPSCHEKMDYTEERRKKVIGNTNAARRKIIRVGVNDEKIVYESVTEAGEKNNILRTAIHNCLKGLSKKAGDYKWIYLKEGD